MRVGTVATSVPPAAVRSPWRTLVILALLAAVVFLVALLTGSSGIGLREALAALAGSGDEATRNVLIEVRLPRVLAAFGVGSLLALSGVLLQALFRNSLADPYVLGVSGGAAVGALLAMIAGAPPSWCSPRRWPGRSAAVGLVYLLGPRRRHGAPAAHRGGDGERLRGAGERAARARRLLAGARHGVLAGRGSRLGGAALAECGRGPHRGRRRDPAGAATERARRRRAARPQPSASTLEAWRTLVFIAAPCSPPSRW